MAEFLNISQGTWHLADAEDLEKDAEGFTNPNLHRRIDTSSAVVPGEYKSRDYVLSINGVNSFRVTGRNVHNELDNHIELP